MGCWATSSKTGQQDSDASIRDKGNHTLGAKWLRAFFLRKRTSAAWRVAMGAMFADEEMKVTCAGTICAQNVEPAAVLAIFWLATARRSCVSCVGATEALACTYWRH